MSAGFACPEQYQTSSKIRPNADLWSFGVMAYWMFTATMPFDNYFVLSDAKVYADLLEEIENNDDIPFEYHQLIKECLVYNPEERIKTAGQCLSLIQGVKVEESVGKYQSERAETILLKPQNGINKNANMFINLQERLISNYPLSGIGEFGYTVHYCEVCGCKLPISDIDVKCPQCKNNIHDKYITSSCQCNNCGFPLINEKGNYCSNCGIFHKLQVDLFQLDCSNLEIFYESYEKVRSNSEFYSKNPEIPLIISSSVYNNILNTFREALSKIGIETPADRNEIWGYYEYNVRLYDFRQKYKIVEGSPFYRGWSLCRDIFASMNFLISSGGKLKNR